MFRLPGTHSHTEPRTSVEQHNNELRGQTEGADLKYKELLQSHEGKLQNKSRKKPLESKS